MSTLNKILVLLVVVILISIALPVAAQCPMCRASAETSLENGATMAAGLNKGILYLFATPYLIVATIGFFWWKANRKGKLAEG